MKNGFILNIDRIIEDFTQDGTGTKGEALQALAVEYDMGSDSILSHGHTGRIISGKLAKKLKEDGHSDYFLDVKELLYKINATGTTLMRGNEKVVVSIMVLEYPDIIEWVASSILKCAEDNGIDVLKLDKIQAILDDSDFFIFNENGTYELNIAKICELLVE